MLSNGRLCRRNRAIVFAELLYPHGDGGRDMKSALECFHEAARFEQLARGATSEVARRNFLARAHECRKLAEKAQATDTSQIQALRELS